MKIIQKHCLNCGQLFHPDPRTAQFQKFCGHKACQQARRRRNLRRWRSLHPDYTKHYQPKVRAWAKSYPNYWRHYRLTHPEYVKQDNHRRVLARRKAKLSAKETAMSKIILEKLHVLDTIANCDVSAKETAMSHRVNAIEDCLRSFGTMFLSAKQNSIALRIGLMRT